MLAFARPAQVNIKEQPANELVEEAILLVQPRLKAKHVEQQSAGMKQLADFEKLKFDGVASHLSRLIDKSQTAVQVAIMIPADLCNKEGRQFFLKIQSATLKAPSPSIYPGPQPDILDL